MIEAPEQLHRAFQEAFNRHDLASIVALYEPGAVLASFDGPVEGADAIRERYRGALAMQPSIDVRTLLIAAWLGWWVSSQSSSTKTSFR